MDPLDWTPAAHHQLRCESYGEEGVAMEHPINNAVAGWLMERLQAYYPRPLARDELRKFFPEHRFDLDDTLLHFERRGILHRILAKPEDLFVLTVAAWDSVEATNSLESGDPGSTRTLE
jgi:hypothetical protein